MKNKYKVLAIETSCDETSASVVQDGRDVLSNVVSSQIDIHTRFGGVVPEIASRNHITAIDHIVGRALDDAGVQLTDIDAIAVTYGAGLVGALLVGVSYAKALSYATGKPLYAVSHIQGHIASNYISHADTEPPFVCLLVSGGHTALLHVTGYNEHTVLSDTLDDAAGEAFDKVARVLGLGYPGGPKIQECAVSGRSDISFVRANYQDTLGLNFSFSGKKTAVINYINNHTQKGESINVCDIASSFQRWVVDELVHKALLATRSVGESRLVVAGGVSANAALRAALDERAKPMGISVTYPQLKYCTDNAAMIGSAGYYMVAKGMPAADMTLTPKSNIPL